MLTAEEIKKDIRAICKSTHWRCNTCSHMVVDEGEVIDKVSSYVKAQLANVCPECKGSGENPDKESLVRMCLTCQGAGE